MFESQLIVDAAAPPAVQSNKLPAAVHKNTSQPQSIFHSLTHEILSRVELLTVVFAFCKEVM